MKKIKMHFHLHPCSGNSFITQECKAKILLHFKTKQQKNEIIYLTYIFFKQTHLKYILLS